MAKVDVYRPYVEKTVKEYLGLDNLIVADNGDIPVRYGSAQYLIRLMDGDPPLMRVFAVLLEEVEDNPDLYKELNTINSNIVSARLFYLPADKIVVAATEVPVETLDKEELAHCCWAVGTLAEWADTELHKKFGGKMRFDDDKPDEQPTDV